MKTFLIILLLYWLLGPLTAAVGPISYVGFHFWPVFSFTLIVFIFFAAGASLLSVNLCNSKTVYRTRYVSSFCSGFLSGNWSTACLLALLPVRMLMQIGRGSSLSIGANYLNAYTDYQRGELSDPLLLLVDCLITPLTVVFFLRFFANGISFRISSLKISTLASIFVAVLWCISFLVLDGKLRYVFDLFLLYLTFRQARALFNCYGVLSFPLIKLNSSFWKVFAAIVLAVSVICYASYSLISRYDQIGLVSVDLVISSSNEVVTLNPFYTFLPQYLLMPFVLLSAYLSGGYFALSTALTLPAGLTPDYHPLAFSYALTRIIELVLGVHLEYVTYLSLVDDLTGWGISKYHTAYTYIASSFSFFSVPFVFALFGFLYAFLWRRISMGYFAWTPLFFVFNLTIFYAPANLQVFHSPGLLFSLIFFSVAPRLKASRRSLNSI